MATFDESSAVVEKAVAARHLLDRAIEALRAGDHLSAIVLGGTAEDLFEGMLKQRGRQPVASRQQLVKAVPAVFKHLFPGELQLSEDDAYNLIRHTFNWLRHADKVGEPQTKRLNLRAEAVALCMRAVDNLWELTGEEHPAARELGYPVGSQ